MVTTDEMDETDGPCETCGTGTVTKLGESRCSACLLDDEFKARAQRILDRINWMLADDAGRDPRYRYFRGPNQEMFCWTTEKMRDGKFAAFEYRPIGKGSRTGKARRWKIARELHFAQRKTAKARAQKWWEASRAAKTAAV